MPLEEFLPSSLSGPQAMGAVTFLFFLAGLWLCLFGYAWFRIQLTLNSLMLGVMAVHVLLRVWGANLPGPVCFLLYALGAVVLAASAWSLFRVYVAAFVLATAVGAYVLLSPSLATGIVFGAIVGLGLAALAWMFTRGVIIAGSALCGAGLAVAGAAAVFLPTRLLNLIAAPAENVPAILTLAAVTMVMAGTGAYVQSRYTSRLRLAVVPAQELDQVSSPAKGKTVTTRDGRKRPAPRPAMA